MQHNNENDLLPTIVFAIVILIGFYQFFNPVIEDFLAVDWKKIGIIFGTIVGTLILAFFIIRKIILSRGIKRELSHISLEPETPKKENQVITKIDNLPDETKEDVNTYAI